MPASISKRAFIQWLPEKPFENTSTLVVTSLEGRFVDIRLFKPLDIGSTITTEQLDWAFAGTSVTNTVAADQYGLKTVSTKQYKNFVDDLDGMDDRDLSEEPSDEIKHTTWRHTVDSRHRDSSNVTDEGDMYFVEPLGMVLEAGAMANPATGRPTEYREGWIDVEIEPPSTCQVLELVSSDAKGMLVRVGQWLQAVSRHGNEFSLQRWRLIEGDWILHASMGSGTFPTESAVNDTATVGTIFETKDSSGRSWQWKVVESSTV